MHWMTLAAFVLRCLYLRRVVQHVLDVGLVPLYLLSSFVEIFFFFFWPRSLKLFYLLLFFATIINTVDRQNIEWLWRSATWCPQQLFHHTTQSCGLWSSLAWILQKYVVEKSVEVLPLNNYLIKPI